MQFGVAQTSKSMPESQLGYFPSDDVKSFVLNFLKEYFEKYDSDKRSSLLDVYAEDSVFTLSVSPADKNVDQKCHRYDDAYFSISRNLLRVKGGDRRKKMITSGKLQTVSVLDRLPKTQHFLDSFRVDILYHDFQACTIFFNVVGVFRELEDNIIRVFSRTMQVNAPSTIKVDNFIISHPTIDVLKKYRDSTSAVKSSSVDPPQTAPLSTQAIPIGENPNLVLLMMEKSGMNESFSRQCLSDFNFDFDNALRTFMALKEAGKIPPEAFARQ